VVMPSWGEILKYLFMMFLIGGIARLLGCFPQRRDPCPRCFFSEEMDSCRTFCDTYRRYLRRIKG